MLDLKLIHHEDQAVTRLQQNVREVLNSTKVDLGNHQADIDSRVKATPAASGVQFTAADTDVVVPHGLGRAATGYTPSNPSAGAVIYTSPTKNHFPQKQIILRASAPVTADLLIF